MPIYEYKCEKGHSFDRYLPLSRYKEEQVCECGASSHKVLGKHFVQNDMTGYLSPIDGTYVGSRSQHKRHMRQHGVIEVGNEAHKTVSKRIQA